MATARKKPAAETHALRFLLNGEERSLTDIDPNLTVLDYLRTAERLTGTKEGCAEGDCGACSVVLGEVDGGGLRYRAVNACILFMPVLDGKQLITVEGLKAADGGLHPAQQAMVDCHGSQCGFCTPGFVMSLFALYKTEASPSRQRINDVLAGNLCRCTGYRPIAEAGEKMYAKGAEDKFSAAEAATVKRLKAIRRKGTLALEAAGRRYFAPRGLDELARLVKAHPKACILAGGTDVGLWVTKLHQDLATLIYTGEVAELGQLKLGKSHMEIGAAVTYSDAEDAIAKAYPGFGELIRRLGSVQIRNSGTIGGNVANGSPIGDSMPALIALGATLVLRNGAKSREIPLEDFYLAYRKTDLKPGEFVERLRLPQPAPGRRFQTWKISKRFDQDISAVCGAWNLELDGEKVRDIRICYGGMAATPKRARRCEEALIGTAWNEPALAPAAAALAEDYQPMTDMRASSGYRMLVAQNLLTKFFRETSNHKAEGHIALWNG